VASTQEQTKHITYLEESCSGLCPSSDSSKKHNVSETGSDSVLRYNNGGTYSVAFLNHCVFRNIGWWTKSKNMILLSGVHHRQNTLKLILPSVK
jgi:hypothetical protein